MGLIGKGIKYGGLFLVAREGLKAIEKHNNNKRAQHAQQALEEQPAPYAYQQPPYQQQSREMQPQYQDQPSEVYSQSQQPSGLEPGFHQVWCNGRCEGRCGAKEALMGLQQSQQGYRDEKKAPLPY
jgi:hypothetical protein